jgi:hypothetical protein
MSKEKKGGMFTEERERTGNQTTSSYIGKERKKRKRESEKKKLASRLSPVHGVKGGVKDRYTA